MPKSFQDDHVKFITELRDFFESYEGKEGKEFINQFSEEFWVSNFLSQDMKEAMYLNCNQMCKEISAKAGILFLHQHHQNTCQTKYFWRCFC